MNKRIILTAAFFGMIAVVLGAFGAHGLSITSSTILKSLKQSLARKHNMNLAIYINSF